MDIEQAYKEVLDAIDCDTEGEERCVLLKGAVGDAMLAVLEECWQAAHNEYGYVGEVEFAVALNAVRAQIAALGPQEHAEPPQEEGSS